MNSPTPGFILGEVDEDEYMPNTSFSPSLQQPGTPFQFAEQFINPFDLLCGDEAGQWSFPFEWPPQPQYGMPSSCQQYLPSDSERYPQGYDTPLDIPAATYPWTDHELMDLTLDFNFNQEVAKPVISNAVDQVLTVGVATNPADECASKPRWAVFNHRQNSILRKWVASNPEPYPSKEEKDSLANSTGLKVDQISRWFARTRVRKLKRVNVTSASTGDNYDIASYQSFMRCLNILQEELRIEASVSIPQSPIMFHILNLAAQLGSLPGPSKMNIRDSVERLLRSSHGWISAYKDFPTAGTPRAEELYDTAETELYEMARVYNVSSFLPSAKGVRCSLESIQSREYILLIQIKSKIDVLLLLFFRARLKKLGLELMDLKKQFGIISAPISDISPHSAFLAYSYMSLGPRKGRRVPFHTSQDVRESSDHTYSSDVAHGTLPGEEVWSHKHFSRQRNATNPGPDKDCRIASSKQRTVYPCSSCPRTFNTRYLQKRHEDSIHNLRVQWVCGPGLLADLGLETTCPICKIAIRVGNKDTTCPHRFEECWAKRKDERAFSRKDTLNQHIRIVHCKGDATLLSTACIDLNSWKEDTDTANRGIVTQPALSSGIPERPKQTRHHIEQ